MTHSGTCIDGPLNGKSYVCIHTSFGVLTNLDTVEPNKNKPCKMPYPPNIYLDGTYTITPNEEHWNWSPATRQERQDFQKKGY